VLNGTVRVAEQQEEEWVAIHRNTIFARTWTVTAVLPQIQFSCHVVAGYGELYKTVDLKLVAGHCLFHVCGG